MTNIITEKHCRQILLDQDRSFNFESFDLKPLEQESLGGLIGLHYILKIRYKDDDYLKTIQLFVKTLNDRNKVMFKVSKNLLFFEKEKLFFMDLLPNYKKIGINVEFAPHGYYCGDNSVILEDLSLSGFKLYPKEKAMDIKHSHACLATLADFHASSLIYEICESKSTEKNFNLLKKHSGILEDLIYSGGDTYGAKYIEESVRGLIALAELEFDDNTTLEQLKNVFSSSVSSTYDRLRCVLLHGDLWTNNFLHKYDTDGAIIKTKLIDFQTIKYGPPALDVLQFIYTNTRKSLRDNHFEDFLSFYYQKLDELFIDRALLLEDYLPRDQFFETCNSFKLQTKLQAVIDRCLTCIPDNVHKNTISNDEKFNDFIFENRAKYLVDYYLQIPNYREIVSEDLRELRDMLS